jgi:hypothetical protein
VKTLTLFARHKGGWDMSCIRVILTVFVITWGMSCSAPPVTADTENAYMRRNLVVNRHDPNDPTSPPAAAIIDPLLLNPWGAAIRSAGLGGHFWLANATSATVRVNKSIPYVIPKGPSSPLMGCGPSSSAMAPPSAEPIFCTGRPALTRRPTAASAA